MNITIRPIVLDDYESLKDAMIEAYRPIGGQYWRKERIQKLVQIFPEGQFCVEVDGRVVGCALSIVVSHAQFGGQHTFDQVTGNYSFDTHDPDSDILYGIEVVVHPKYRGLQLGRRLYNARKQCCEQFNLRAIMAGGRIPSYCRYADQMPPQVYLELVKQNALHDPTLSFQLANGFRVRSLLTNYLKGDTESREYATLLEWKNALYNPILSLSASSKLIYTHEHYNHKPNTGPGRSESCSTGLYETGYRYESAT